MQDFETWLRRVKREAQRKHPRNDFNMYTAVLAAYCRRCPDDSTALALLRERERWARSTLN